MTCAAFSTSQRAKCNHQAKAFCEEQAAQALARASAQHDQLSLAAMDERLTHREIDALHRLQALQRESPSRLHDGVVSGAPDTERFRVKPSLQPLSSVDETLMRIHTPLVSPQMGPMLGVFQHPSLTTNAASAAMLSELHASVPSAGAGHAGTSTIPWDVLVELEEERARFDVSARRGGGLGGSVVR
ncbi:MAG: hypothetical protein EOO65_05495 [Methanosarcinales archaeon]|nr:MAG: hypothetical protein EOO65_05495 [Methanosarcinales archaeon]